MVLEQRSAERQQLRPGNGARAEPAGWRELPGRSCLWIRKGWVRVWCVFSCGFQSLFSSRIREDGPSAESLSRVAASLLVPSHQAKSLAGDRRGRVDSNVVTIGIQ